MATPIKATPVLSGQDSRSFNKVLFETQKTKISDTEKEHISALVSKVLSKKLSK